MSFKRTKAQISDLEDRTKSSGQQIITDGAGHFVLGSAGGGHSTGTVIIYDEGDWLGVFTAMDMIGAGVQAFNSGSYAAIAVTGSAGGGGGGGSGSYPIAAITGVYDSSTRNFSTNTTWMYVAGTSGSFTLDRDSIVTAYGTIRWGGTNTNWEFFYWRLKIDGVDQGLWAKTREQAPQNNEKFVHSTDWIASLSSGLHTFTMEVYTASGLNFSVLQTQVTILAHEGGTAWVPLI